LFSTKYIITTSYFSFKIVSTFFINYVRKFKCPLRWS
jgi:hypothetical protein